MFETSKVEPLNIAALKSAAKGNGESIEIDDETAANLAKEERRKKREAAKNRNPIEEAKAKSLKPSKCRGILTWSKPRIELPAGLWRAEREASLREICAILAGSDIEKPMRAGLGDPVFARRIAESYVREDVSTQEWVGTQESVATQERVATQPILACAREESAPVEPAAVPVRAPDPSPAPEPAPVVAAPEAAPIAAKPEPATDEDVRELVRRIAALDAGRGADWNALAAAWPGGEAALEDAANRAFDLGAIYEPILGRFKATGYGLPAAKVEPAKAELPAAKPRRYLMPTNLGRIVGAAFYPATDSRAAIAGFLTGNRDAPENPATGYSSDGEAWTAYKAAVKAVAAKLAAKPEAAKAEQKAELAEPAKIAAKPEAKPLPAKEPVKEPAARSEEPAGGNGAKEASRANGARLGAAAGLPAARPSGAAWMERAADGQSGLVVAWGWDAARLERFKAAVPGEARRWEASRRFWSIAPAAWATVLGWAESEGLTVSKGAARAMRAAERGSEVGSELRRATA